MTQEQNIRPKKLQSTFDEKANQKIRYLVDIGLFLIHTALLNTRKNNVEV